MTVMGARHNLRKLVEKFDSVLVTVSPFYFVVEDSESHRLALACVSKDRWNSPQIDDCFHDSPELAVHVVSREDTVLELRHKRDLCLRTGAIEFWLVHPMQSDVEVYRADRELTTYRQGQKIPLFFADGETVSVDSIFEPI